MRSPTTQPAGKGEDQYEDDFVVNDEEGMENDYENEAEA